MKFKMCVKCKVKKRIYNFYFNINRNSYSCYCKKCDKQLRKNYYKQHKEKISKQHKQYYQISKVYRLSHTKKTNRMWRKKNKNYYGIWQKQHKEKIKIYSKKYRKKHKKQIKKWRTKNKNYLNQSRKKYNKVQYKNNKIFKIKCLLRNRFYSVLKHKKKYGSAIKMLGCSIEFFKRHLESQFKEGMSWKNYGRNGWVIDHIKPFCFFDLSKKSEQKRVCHYTNLQPLWNTENMKKYYCYDRFLK